MVNVLYVRVARRYCETSQQLLLCGGRVLVRHKLGELVGGTRVWAIRTLTHPKESLLLPFLHAQLLFKELEGLEKKRRNQNVCLHDFHINVAYT